jgi:Ycf4
VDSGCSNIRSTQSIKTDLFKMSTPPTTIDETILIQPVLGSRRFSNFFWAIVVSIGGIGFLLAGLSSYLKVNLLPVSNPLELAFIPQGIALSFYGVAGTLLATYLWLSILLDIGGGYNEFNQETGDITIFRNGFPGKNRRIELISKIKDAQAVRVDIKDGLSPRRNIYVRIKGRREIPLTRVGEPISLAELETQGANLARFLGVPLEGL